MHLAWCHRLHMQPANTALAACQLVGCSRVKNHVGGGNNICSAFELRCNPSLQVMEEIQHITLMSQEQTVAHAPVGTPGAATAQQPGCRRQRPTATQSVQQQHCSSDDVAAGAVAVWKRSWSLPRVDYSRTAGPAAAAAAAPAPLRGRCSLRPSPPAAALAAFVLGGIALGGRFCSRLASS